MSPRTSAATSPAPRAERPETLALLADWAARRYAAAPALRHRAARPTAESPESDRGWTVVSYRELGERVRHTARELIGRLGVRAQDRVAILGDTSPEWTETHLAVLAAGAVLVPVYPTAGDGETTWVLNDSGSAVVVCSDEGQLAKVERLRRQGALPGVRHALTMAGTREGPTRSGSADESRSGSTDEDAPPCSSRELAERGRSVAADDLCAIVYTSGTTGPPKGCMLSHHNLTALYDATVPLIDGGAGTRTYLYLPLAHLLAQLVEFRTLLRGGELCYFGGRIEDVVSELAEVRPTHLPSVPRLFEKVHEMVLGVAESQGPGGRERFDAAVRVGLQVAEVRERGEEPRGELRERYQRAEEALFSQVRGVFGGRLRWTLSGAAPIARTVLDFLRACGITVYEGYGMTESGGIVALSHPGAARTGSVGHPIPGCEVRIADDGEVLARGATVFRGYHNNPTATREVLDGEGWLHTGDVGTLDTDGYLTITGRKKDLIITSGGKNLSPAEVELAVEESRYVSHALLVGDHRPYPVALVTVDADATAGLSADEVRQRVRAAVAAANARVARPARIREFAVLERDFTVESGELTPTLKVRRKLVTERYAARIAALYERPEADPPTP